MPEEKTVITINKNIGTPTQDIVEIKTSGFLLFYLENDKIKSEGEIELKALAPLFMKLALDKLTR